MRGHLSHVLEDEKNWEVKTGGGTVSAKLQAAIP